MKKKFISSVVAALMVLTMGTTVFAASSPTTDTVTGVADATVVTVKTVDKTTEAKVEKAAESKALEQVGANNVAEVVAVYEIKPTEATKAELAANGKVAITLNADVKAGETVYIYHEFDEGGSEIIPATVVDGKVTFDVTSFSKFAIVKVTKTTYNGWAGYPWGATTETAAATTAATSPKTADAAPVLPVLAVICLAGVVVCGKKVKFNN